jgi:uncharacterized protein YfcZ (UPF0381/DUF406 family)
MTNLATHIRIFDAQPDDDLVAKRSTAIAEISQTFKKQKTADDLLQTANDLAQAVEHKGRFSERLSKEIEGAISQSAVSFVADKNELQMATCGMLGALQAIDGTLSDSNTILITDVLALGLWCALSFQSPSANARLEDLRTELMNKAHELVMRRASASRRRKEVPDAKFPPLTAVDPKTVEKSFDDGVSVTVEALRANSAVDREELDLLWWVLSDRSDLLKRRLSTDKNSASRAIACGIEAGQLLRRMPSTAHLHLVLRNLADDDAQLSLTDVVRTVGADRDALASPFAESSTIAACPAVFPLLTALRSGTSFDGNAEQKRPLEDWAARALLESAILRLIAHVPSVAV